MKISFKTLLKTAMSLVITFVCINAYIEIESTITITIDAINFNYVEAERTDHTNHTDVKD